MAPAASFIQESDSNNKVMCVMDAASQFGARLVERLLERGYTVHAAVQSQSSSSSGGGGGDGGDDSSHLFNGIVSSSEMIKKKRLKIFHSDLFDFQSLIDALKGCSGLFYSFEPPKDQPTYDEFMMDVEVRAAHNVIEACAQTDTIDKVVFTSSATAIVWREDSDSALVDLDEKNWSDINLCRKYKLWHALSKTVAEKAAWALAMDRGVSMVSLNAGLIISPDLSIKNPYLKGAAEMYEDGVFVTVDLDYLVDAHICIYEDISSYGRYLCFNHLINREEDCIKLAKLMTPDAPTPVQRCDKDAKIIQQRISNKKLNKLMVDFKSSSK